MVDDDDGGTDSSTHPDVAANDVAVKDVTTDVTPKDSATDSPTDSSTPMDSSVSDASDGGSPTTFTLTIRDYLSWCSLKVNGGGASIADPQSFPGLAYDASVALNGVSASDASFYWGYWQGPGIGDGGQDLNQSVTLQITGDVTVHACCPDNGFPLTQCTF